jgi:hypothetical protein
MYTPKAVNPKDKSHLTTPKSPLKPNLTKGPYTQNPNNTPGIKQVNPKLNEPSEISEDDQECRVQNNNHKGNPQATE